MLKNFTLLAACCCSIGLSVAQPGKMVWQRSFGGSLNDYGVNAIELPGHNIIIGGQPYSTDGDMATSHGLTDVFLSSINPDGTVAWQRTFGGSSYDDLRMLAHCPDGNFVAVAVSESTDGDITDNKGLADAWVIKMDKNGNIIWQRNYGTKENDMPSDIIATTDGGFIITGCRNVWRKDANGADDMSTDLWIVKLDAQGNETWAKTYGGQEDDMGNKIIQTPDKGYIIAGNTSSSDGNVTTANKGYADGWIVKLDDKGNIVWQHSYGGEMADMLTDIAVCSNGDYMFLGATSSLTGDIGGSKGMDDIWLLRMTPAGKLVWHKTYGGSYPDLQGGICRTKEGNFMIAGSTQSHDGDLTGAAEMEDTTYGSQWIFLVNEAGNLIWQNRKGGSNREMANDIIQLDNGAYLCLGHTYSASGDGDIAFNHGTDNSSDIWVYQLQNPTAIKDISAQSTAINVYPSVSSGDFYIATLFALSERDISVTDITGRKQAYILNRQQGSYQLSMPQAVPGTYYITLYHNNEKQVRTVVIAR